MTRTIKMINFFGLTYGFIYGFLLSYFYSYYSNHKSENPNFRLLIFWFFLAILSYIILQISYYSSHNYKYNLVKTGVLSSLNKEKKYCFRIALILTLIGSLSVIVWSIAYGGITEVLIRASMIRGGYDHTHNKFSFLIRFAPVLLLSTILIIRLILTQLILLYY